jgi:hypothetical protein
VAPVLLLLLLLLLTLLPVFRVCRKGAATAATATHSLIAAPVVSQMLAPTFSRSTNGTGRKVVTYSCASSHAASSFTFGSVALRPTI